MKRMFSFVFLTVVLTACGSDTVKEPNNGANNGQTNNGINNGSNNGAPMTCDGTAIDTGEACDGTDLGGESCISLGFSGGTLACRADCLGFDTSACEREQGGNIDEPCPPEQHLCDSMCVLDEEGPGCGPNCELCPTDAVGVTYCASGMCGLQCDPGYQLCDGACAQCPGGETYACDAGACVAATCPQGQYNSEGSCLSWQTSSEIGDSSNHPSSPSVVVGDDGTVHVAYFNGWSGGIRYATYDGAWTDTAIGVQDSGTPSPSIALDPSGNPHIGGAMIGSDGLTQGFGHFWHNGSSWESELILAGERPFGSMIIDDAGTIHVAFRRLLGAQASPNGAIPDRKISHVLYGQKTVGGAWELTSIDQEDDLGYNLSVPGFAMAPDGRFYIAYGDGFRVRLAEGLPNGFTRSILARGKVSSTELALTPSGELSAVYFRVWDEDGFTTAAPPNQLFYAIRSAGVWTETTLHGVDGEYIGFNFGLAYGPDGFANISHYVGSNAQDDTGSLHLVQQTATGWEYQLVDATGQPGLSSALTFDQDGRPHIVAEDNSMNRLKYYRVQ